MVTWRWLLILLAILLGPNNVRSAYAQAIERPGGNTSVFLPLLASYEVAATPVREWNPGQMVYGLVGRIEQPTAGRFTTYLITEDDQSYRLVGETPDMERQILALASQEPRVLVKAWGRFGSSVRDAEQAIIVVSGILSTADPVSDGSPPVPPVAIVRYDRVNLYAGPAQYYGRKGQLSLNEACAVVGTNHARTWWRVDCGEGEANWIDSRLVEVEGDTGNVAVVTPVITVQPVATPIPTPPPVTPIPVSNSMWQASLYANQRLSGQPAAYAAVETVHFNWGSGSPSNLLPADGFSIRFEKTDNFVPGLYRFEAQADDGVRVWLDDALLIDEWHGAGGRTYAANRVLFGLHDLRVEYYEAAGLASVRFGYSASSQQPQWDAAYYAGTSPDGLPLIARQESLSANPLDYNWGYSSPQPGILGSDFWSARWSGDFAFDRGDYVFRAVADDGIRVYVDGLAVIDQWRDGSKDVSNRYIGIGDGMHEIEVEYYERSGLAQVEVWWFRDPQGTGPS